MHFIRHVNEYPTMHHFGNPRHTQSMIAFIRFLLSISGNSSEKLHCGNFANMRYFGIPRYTQSTMASMILTEYFLEIWSKISM